MPEISRFFGVVVAMFQNDHSPPHFHVRYGDEKATVIIESSAILSGRVSPRVRGLVTEWAAAHRIELMENWQRARQGLPLRKVEPLE